MASRVPSAVRSLPAAVIGAVGERLPGPVTAAGGRYAHIDALRAFAVMLVVIAHAGVGQVVPGGSGVTIFFSISGFIITFLLLRERDRTDGFSIARFYMRRGLKILPPLFAAILIPTALFELHYVDPLAFASQIFFFYNWLYASGRRVLPGSEVLWSLAIEEQFYIGFALIWLLVYRSRHYRRILTAVGVVAVFSSLSARFWFALSGAHSGRIYYGTDTRLDGIALGVLTAILYHRWLHEPEALPRLRRLLTRDAAVVVAVLLYLFSLAYRGPFFRDTLRFSMQSVATCLVIVFGLLAASTPVSRLISRLANASLVRSIGLASYSIYLVHLVVNWKVDPWLPSHPRALHFTLLVLAGVIGGYLLYRIVEVPFEHVRARLHRDLRVSRPEPAAGGAAAPAPASTRA